MANTQFIRLSPLPSPAHGAPTILLFLFEKLKVIMKYAYDMQAGLKDAISYSDAIFIVRKIQVNVVPVAGGYN